MTVCAYLCSVIKLKQCDDWYLLMTSLLNLIAQKLDFKHGTTNFISLNSFLVNINHDFCSFFSRGPIIRHYLPLLPCLWTEQASEAEKSYKVFFQMRFCQHSPQLLLVNYCLSQVLLHIQIASIEVISWPHTSERTLHMWV